MNIPRHWVRVKLSMPVEGMEDPFVTEAYGHSDVSEASAQADAIARAQRVAAWWRRVVGDEEGPDLVRYTYGSDRPVREPIVQEFHDDRGERVAVITRNAYGALVLNTARVAIIDVDLPPQVGIVGRLFGKRSKGADEVRDGIRAAAESGGVGGALYRTPAGFRFLVTTELVDPTTPRSDELLGRFGSDPKYRALCRVQRSFRARLTAKPWRCGMVAPPVEWPFRDAAHEARFRAWLERYERAAQPFAACERLGEVGRKGVLPEAAAIVAEHDRRACRSGAALA